MEVFPKLNLIPRGDVTAQRYVSGTGPWQADCRATRTTGPEPATAKTEDEPAATYKDSKQVVDMTALGVGSTPRHEGSRCIGQKTYGGEATGHKEGCRIVDMLGRKKADLTDEDVAT
ncbi:hypothetical protein GCM10007887_15160 [Methylobacterium haplocladii]|uniref:Uncharacterized protein n=1 Tax=Methylobacterium haplocladii TaxID=1176176 RepID=A0A512IT78_9HYPH|nr:DUF3140 domain-containing protein [Methylobacterium haplocladii]GEP00918.1 hypothetical protein MHA02_33050 [Methylobacterium haplocladii]GLS58850.1 hypothetical protein GCM10007887_15160 [Methylobacterium haplocladii]